jgi:hypothetical protein
MRTTTQVAPQLCECGHERLYHADHLDENLRCQIGVGRCLTCNCGVFREQVKP